MKTARRGPWSARRSSPPRSITKRTSAAGPGHSRTAGAAGLRSTGTHRTEPTVDVGAAVDQLVHSGYAVLAGLANSHVISDALEQLSALRIASRSNGEWSSFRKLHIENLLDAGPTLERIWLAKPLLVLAGRVLGHDFRVLGVRYRAPLPGFGEQTLHSDDPASTVESPRVLSVIVPLVDFMPSNGATRFLPGSHTAPPPGVPEGPLTAVPGQRSLTCSAGTAFVFNGALWHSGTRNLTMTPRHAIAISYVRSDSGLLQDVYATESTLSRLGQQAKILRP